MATLTVYPTEDSPVVNDPADTTWATLHNATGGTSVDRTGTVNSFALILGGTSSPNWSNLIRSGFVFDITALGAGATISAATFSLYGTLKTDGGTAITPNLNIYSFTPADPAVIAVADFDQFGTTAYCDTAITYAGFSTAGYNDFALNATGISHLDSVKASGKAKIGTRNANYDVADSAPTWSSESYHYLYGSFVDTAGTVNDPKLVVTYTTTVTNKHNLLLMGCG